LPKNEEEKSNFAFIENVFKKAEEFLKALKAQEYFTAVGGNEN
jgi:hypothetical protein